MLGKVGSLQNIPAPSATVLNEALKLLSTFGDSKSISKLLEQVREVQANNEQVLRDAQAVMSSLQASQRALEDSQKEFASHAALENASLKRRADELSKAEAQLSGRIAKFNQEQSAAKAKIAEAEESLAIAEKAVNEREAGCEAKEAELANIKKHLSDYSESLIERDGRVSARERRLQAAFDGP